jgi:hypothetical protein
MPIIQLSTPIAAPPEREFDLARSIDAHQQSAEGTLQRAIAGVTSGLIGMGDQVTWKGRHFGIKHKADGPARTFHYFLACLNQECFDSATETA